MTEFRSRIFVEDPFPEDLAHLTNAEVEVLNSRIQRALDAEYLEFGTPYPETECRREFLKEELDRRDSAAIAAGAKAVRKLSIKMG